MTKGLLPKYGKIITYISPPSTVHVQHDCRVNKSIKKLGLLPEGYAIGTRWMCPCTQVWEYGAADEYKYGVHQATQVTVTTWRRVPKIQEISPNGAK